MKYLSKESFEKAKKWILDNGRPLEKARLHFYFDGGDVKTIHLELEKFQNKDGGFGHALEPDLRTPDSSVLATSLAFQISRSLPSAVQYLLNNYDTNVSSWRIIPETAENYPHAPWWNQLNREDYFSGFHLNPTAEILGYLPKFDSELGEMILRKLKNLEEIEMHDFLCCKRLSESKILPENFQQSLILELDRLLSTCVVTDSSKWSGYGLRPIQVADSPDSIYLIKLQKSVEENLDYEIDHQDDSGVWLPVWTWQGEFPDEWETAKKEWTGIITLEKLLILKRFGRIA